MKSRTRKIMALVCALLTFASATGSVWAGAPADDLKQIEYRYYFRGKYPQAIEALQTFLARIDVTGPVALRASEFLAASHVLAGSPAAGKDVFARLIVSDPAYTGPDATVFKAEVIDVYHMAREDHASMAMQNASPVPEDSLAVAQTAPATTGTANAASKPIYKKWWFYAGAAAIAGIAAAAAGGGGDDSDSRAAGTVVVGVTVK